MTRYYGRVLEGEMALTLTAWGCWLIAPWDTFANSASFGLMGRLGSETGWGALIALIGGLQLIAVIMGDRRLRFGAAVMALLVWVSLVGMFIVANYTSTGIPVYTGMALMTVTAAFFTFAMLRRDRDRLRDDQAETMS